MRTSMQDASNVLDCLFLKRGSLLYLEQSRAVYGICWEMDSDTGFLKAGATAGKGEFLEASKGFCFRPGEGMIGKAYEGLLPGSVELISDMRKACPVQFFRKREALLAGIESVVFLRDQSSVYEFGYESAPEEGLVENISALVSKQHQVGSGLRRTLSISTESTMDSRSRTDSFGTDSTVGSTVGDFESESMTCVSCTPSRTRSPSPANRYEGWPNPGSVGHPYCCQAPCRFQHRGKGCKDGSNCDKCHLCRFTRAGARQKGIQKP